jgi:hypothetical protein
VSVRAAPIFPVSDLDAALAYYGRLGFDTRRWPGGGFIRFGSPISPK